jgi:hypothetical protein
VGKREKLLPKCLFVIRRIRDDGTEYFIADTGYNPLVDMGQTVIVGVYTLDSTMKLEGRAVEIID